MLKHFFDISTGFGYKKMEKSSPSIYRDVHALFKTASGTATFLAKCNP